jgi:predicted RNase H-like HicB family nuclease
MKLPTSSVTGQAQGSILTSMNLNALIERDLATGLLVGSVPGIPGAHTQGETIEEVRTNLAEVIELLQSEDALEPESEFIATTALMVA